jgi:hypothetical protein
VPADGYLRVFAYYAVKQPDGTYQGGFVQASVTVIGPENFTGTTTTDVQNPLTFTVNKDGLYSVLGICGSFPPQNVTVYLGNGWSNNTYAPLGGCYFEAVLNFGSSPAPSIGTISVSAYYESLEKWINGTGYSCSLVEASVVVTGPENFTGMTTTDTFNPLTFTVVPGQYSMSVTYGSLPPQNETVNVQDGGYYPVTVFFGSGPLPP